MVIRKTTKMIKGSPENRRVSQLSGEDQLILATCGGSGMRRRSTCRTRVQTMRDTIRFSNAAQGSGLLRVTLLGAGSRKFRCRHAARSIEELGSLLLRLLVHDNTTTSSAPIHCKIASKRSTTTQPLLILHRPTRLLDITPDHSPP